MVTQVYKQAKTIIWKRLCELCISMACELCISKMLKSGDLSHQQIEMTSIHIMYVYHVHMSRKDSDSFSSTSESNHIFRVAGGN